MSYSNNPNDPNYVAPGTVPPVVEAVEPAGSNLRWLWWLLGLLVLAGLIWALTRACHRETCSAVPADIWSAESTNAYNAVSAWVPAGTEQVTVTNALRTLCNYRLEHAATGAAGNWFDGNRVANAFTGISGFDTGYVTNIQNVVNTASWCRCS